MAFTQTDLDKIESLLASGVKEIEYNGRRMTYQTAQELLKTRSLLASAIDGNAVQPKRGIVRVTVSNGL